MHVVSSTLVPETRSADAGPAPSRPGAVAAAVGISLPDRVVPNRDIAARIGVDDGWIMRRTGILNRRVAGPGERLDGHAARAGAARSGSRRY